MVVKQDGQEIIVPHVSTNFVKLIIILIYLMCMYVHIYFGNQICLTLAHCPKGCYNGRCMSPNKCKCTTGWSGSRCKQGV